MATNSPQRSRRTQQVQPQGTMPNHPARETSPSPPGSINQRPRAAKTQSMPLVPSLTSFPGQNTQQASPTIRRSSPSLGPGQVARLLPTPPHPNPPTFLTDDQQIASPPAPQQHQPHYARPPPIRAPTAAYPNKFQELESQMTPEFFADIDRAAEQQQAQYHFSNQPQSQSQPHSYIRGESPSPGGKGSIVDRTRGAPPERSSPLNPVALAQRVGGQQQQQGHTRESPKARDRQPASPNIPPFSQSQAQSQTPELQQQQQHSPPSIMTVGDPHPASYLAQYNARESPTVRRAPNSEPRMNIASIVNQSQSTPPLQSIAGRTDRSLPVQEEDEVLSRNGTGSLSGRPANQWGVSDNGTQPSFEAPSPTPSSDLNPEGNINGQRFDVSSNGHHDDEKVKLTLVQQQQEDEGDHAQYLERRDSTEEDGSYTPRSPSAGLPNDGSRQMHYAGQNIPIRVPVPVSLRVNKNRNGSTDHIMRGLEGVLLDQQDQQQQQSSATSTASHQQLEQTPERPPPTYHDQRQQQISQSEQYQPSSPQNYSTPTSTTLTTSTSTANNSSTDYNQGLYNHNARYIPQPQVYPDDFQNYPEEYFQAYFTSPGRPDAPIPPTPHSQTAAPSPSPLISGYGGNQDLPNYRPMRAAGSPYPFPFGHVRRSRPVGQSVGGRNSLLSSGLAMDPNRIARQYQIYAQNAHQGNITDSTLSPSSTPFQPDNMFDQWAYLHTARTLNLHHNAAMRGFSNLETASMLSSPSHEPLPLPNFAGRKKEKKGSNGFYKNRNHDRIRQLPPRVESTQPRETSPEISSGSESGEETAGEERHAFGAQTVTIDPLPFPPVVIVDQTDSSDEWIDEDDEDDYEDFLDVEYHPSFVKNVSKRRRKWEVGWENLIQAFQALDRQTDATMVLLASPSHTTKLHALQSRSIRRRPVLAHSQYIKDIRKGFAQISAERRGMRKELASFGDKIFLQSKGDSPSGSEGSSSASVEEYKLKRALRTMAEVYEQREARFVEELQRSREDAELLVRQILGDRSPITSAPSSGVPSSTSS